MRWFGRRSRGEAFRTECSTLTEGDREVPVMEVSVRGRVALSLSFGEEGTTARVYTGLGEGEVGLEELIAYLRARADEGEAWRGRSGGMR